MTAEVQGRIDRLYREEHGRILAPLIRLMGGFERAEEVVHDAFEAALEQWPSGGVPPEPRAWIIRAARNKAIDKIRRSDRWVDKRAELTAIAEVERAFVVSSDEIPDEPSDDMLRLVFTCCHPVLSVDSQVPLTLRTICGLTTEEIARAFLVAVPTMAQRLVRAKKKIREEEIPYRVPPREELGARLVAVQRTLYLVFNEGYTATGGAELVRQDLCREGIRLAELVHALLPSEPAPSAVLALMLLHDARQHTRVDEEGELVLLEHQDRSRWDRDQIERALPLVEAALRGSVRPGAYALQAAIAALHAQASTAEETDWRQIAALYQILMRVAPSPVVELNRAVAVAMTGALEDGLRLIEALTARGSLPRYHLLPAARADLLRRLDRHDEARRAYDEALALVQNDVERRFLARRVDALRPTS